MNQTIESQVINIISMTAKIPVENIRPEQLIADVCESSLDLVNLLFDLEDKFDICIPDDAKYLKTIRDIVIDVEKLIEEKETNLESVE